MTLNHTRDRLYIDGAWVPSTGSGTLPVTNPFTEQVIGTVPDGTAEDVDAAARAAARALPGWSETSLDDRVKACRAIAEGLKARAQEVALYASTEMGAPWQIAVMVQAGLPVIDFASMEDVADQVEWERRSGNSLLVRKPVGVVGAITPWNYPLHQISAKVAPTLLAGGTIVVKPSELVPASRTCSPRSSTTPGLPPGVFNLVTGTGPVVGEAIVKHEAVDMVSFTGSTRAGRRVAELASAAPKRTSLELGGKSASVLLDDLSAEELGNAIAGSLTGCLINSGQTCSATTRLLVPRDRLAEVEGLLEVFVQFAPMGDPMDPATQQGPLVSKRQQESVRAYIQGAVDDGAKLDRRRAGAAGGPADRLLRQADRDRRRGRLDHRAGGGLRAGAHGRALRRRRGGRAADRQRHRLRAVRRGLGLDKDRAVAFAKRMRTGQVGVNGGVFNPTAPFGGFGQSGYGRELGPLGVEEFTAITSLQL
jgi:acyl-CoA reductase-like NAD-dependent aldehyde dehydrogenase